MCLMITQLSYIKVLRQLLVWQGISGIIRLAGPKTKQYFGESVIGYLRQRSWTGLGTDEGQSGDEFVWPSHSTRSSCTQVGAGTLGVARYLTGGTTALTYSGRGQLLWVSGQLDRPISCAHSATRNLFG